MARAVLSIFIFIIKIKENGRFLKLHCRRLKEREIYAFTYKYTLVLNDTYKCSKQALCCATLPHYLYNHTVTLTLSRHALTSDTGEV